MKLLLDTSLLITIHEKTAPILPDEATDVAVSVVSVAELTIGVLAATDPDIRAQRLATLSAVERSYEPLLIDTDVAHTYARLVVKIKASGRKPRVMDTLIGATAIVHECTVATRDEDFHALGDAGVPFVIV